MFIKFPPILKKRLLCCNFEHWEKTEKLVTLVPIPVPLGSPAGPNQ
jgi:hypothetical protein